MNRFPEIICTLGTTTDDRAVLEGMVAAGMGMARINTAYASFDEIARRIDRLREVAPVPVMLDLKGPQLRVDCTTEKVDPSTGASVTVPCRYPIARGDLIYVGFGVGPVRFNHDFEDDLETGDRITFQNGTITTRVADPDEEGIARQDTAVLLEVLEPGSGHMTHQSGANVPGKALRVPRLSARDHEAIALGLSKECEWYALSFVQEPSDLTRLHDELAGRGETRAGLIAKIEETCGVDGLEAIVSQARRCGRPLAVMIARGDLFVELPRERLPLVQADLLRRCRAIGVPSIVATGLLLSMQERPVPARSEVCDVAGAVLGGADSLLLSDETSNSKHPVGAVTTLAMLLRAYRPGG
jgi:pyruvate kinase